MDDHQTQSYEKVNASIGDGGGYELEDIFKHVDEEDR